MRPVCLATGSFYRWTGDMNKAIALCKNFEIDGVEITIGYQSTLTKLKLKKESIDYLKGLEFNTFHAPMKGIIFRKDFKTRKTINKIQVIYHKINAQNSIFHPHKIEDPYYINKTDMQISIENMNALRKISINKIESILNQNSTYGLVLDVNHAATYSLQEIEDYVDKFKDEITEIHVSYFDGKVEHKPISRCDGKIS